MSRLSMKFEAPNFGRSRNDSSSSGYYNLPPRVSSAASNRSSSRPSFVSMSNPTYRIIHDDEDKWMAEIPVDPIFMQHTDKIVVKVNKSTIQITSCVGERKDDVVQEWKLNKRVTLPEDCKLDSIDVACDRKKCVVRVTCDKIEGHTRCMSRESRMASRAGSRCSYSSYNNDYASGFTTPYSSNRYQSRPDSAASRREEPMEHAQKSTNLQAESCKELDVTENNDARWEAKIRLGDKFIGDSSSIKVYKRNNYIIIEKKIPIPADVQQSSVSTYIKEGFAVMMGVKRQSKASESAVNGTTAEIDPTLRGPRPDLTTEQSVKTQAEIHKEMTGQEEIDVPLSKLAPRKSGTAESQGNRRKSICDSDDENDGPIVKVIEDTASKWAVSISVDQIFIDHPNNIKVKVSKKMITIRSQIGTSYLKREVQIPSNVNQKSLAVEAVRDESALILRCNKI